MAGDSGADSKARTLDLRAVRTAIATLCLVTPLISLALGGPTMANADDALAADRTPTALSPTPAIAQPSDGPTSTGEATTNGGTAVLPPVEEAHPAEHPVTSPSTRAEPPIAMPAVGASAAAPGAGRQRYLLEARLDYPGSTLDVREILEWTNTSTAPAGSLDLSVIPAHVGAFELTGPVTVDGKVAEARFAGFDTNLELVFGQPVEPGATAHIVIAFRLTVTEYPSALGGRLSNRRGTIQFGEWFPVWSTRHGFSEIGDPQVTWNAESIVLDLTSNVDLGVDAVAATGTLQRGATASHWRFEARNVRDFAFAVNPEYRLATGTTSCGGRTIELRAYARNADPNALVRRATRAMDSYGAWFGCYVYPTFSVAEVGSPWFSMEFPNIVFIGARVTTREGVIEHEVAHQWWYGIVGNDQINEPWIDEAFAEFSSQLVAGRREACSERSVAGSVHEFESWSPCEQYIETVYAKDADFLHSLRAEMGDPNFFAALRSIVSTYRYRVATTSGILDAFRSETTQDLQPLFDTYGLNS